MIAISYMYLTSIYTPQAIIIYIPNAKSFGGIFVLLAGDLTTTVDSQE